MLIVVKTFSVPAVLDDVSFLVFCALGHALGARYNPQIICHLGDLIHVEYRSLGGHLRVPQWDCRHDLEPGKQYDYGAQHHHRTRVQISTPPDNFPFRHRWLPTLG